MIEVITAIISITAIELYALHKNVDGKIMCLVIGFISGLGGYMLGGM